MLRIERILCPIDFSEFSARAYDYAQSLARHYQAKLFFNTSSISFFPPMRITLHAVDYQRALPEDLRRRSRRNCKSSRSRIRGTACSLSASCKKVG